MAISQRNELSLKEISTLFSNDGRHIQMTHIYQAPLLVYSKRHGRTNEADREYTKNRCYRCFHEDLK